MTDYYTFDKDELFQSMDFDSESSKVTATTHDEIGAFKLHIHHLESGYVVVDIHHDEHAHFGSVVFRRIVYALELFAYLSTIKLAEDSIRNRVAAALESIDENIERMRRD